MPGDQTLLRRIHSTGLVRLVRARPHLAAGGEPGRHRPRGPGLGVAELSARNTRGDPVATAASQAGSYLDMLIENLADTLNPETVVLGGTLCALGAPFVDTALRVMRENAGLHDHHHHTVRMGRFGPDAAALGAAGGVLQRLLNAADALDASPLDVTARRLPPALDIRPHPGAHLALPGRAFAPGIHRTGVRWCERPHLAVRSGARARLALRTPRYPRRHSTSATPAATNNSPNPRFIKRSRRSSLYQRSKAPESRV